jgi:hypothetical protein
MRSNVEFNGVGDLYRCPGFILLDYVCVPRSRYSNSTLSYVIGIRYEEVFGVFVCALY